MKRRDRSWALRSTWPLKSYMEMPTIARSIFGLSAFLLTVCSAGANSHLMIDHWSSSSTRLDICNQISHLSPNIQTQMPLAISWDAASIKIRANAPQLKSSWLMSGSPVTARIAKILILKQSLQELAPISSNLTRALNSRVASFPSLSVFKKTNHRNGACDDYTRRLIVTITAWLRWKKWKHSLTVYSKTSLSRYLAEVLKGENSFLSWITTTTVRSASKSSLRVLATNLNWSMTRISGTPSTFLTRTRTATLISRSSNGGLVTCRWRAWRWSYQWRMSSGKISWINAWVTTKAKSLMMSSKPTWCRWCRKTPRTWAI